MSIKNPELKIHLDNFSKTITDKHMRFLDSSIFVLSAPRSRSTLLMEILSVSNQVRTIGSESNIIYNEFVHLNAKYNHFYSGCLSSNHADEGTKKYIKLMYLLLMQDNNEEKIVNKTSGNKVKPFCFIEKTPGNSLNIPFLLEIFPKARFLVLYRKPDATISSLMEAWKNSKNSGQFISYKKLPNWHLPYWCFLLPYKWGNMIGKSIAEICTFQWKETYKKILKDLKYSDNKTIYIQFESLIQDTQNTMLKIIDFIGLAEDKKIIEHINKSLKPSKSTVTKPSKDKWHIHKREILPLLESTQNVLDELIELTNNKTS